MDPHGTFFRPMPERRAEPSGIATKLDFLRALQERRGGVQRGRDGTILVKQSAFPNAQFRAMDRYVSEPGKPRRIRRHFDYATDLDKFLARFWYPVASGLMAPTLPSDRDFDGVPGTIYYAPHPDESRPVLSFLTREAARNLRTLRAKIPTLTALYALKATERSSLDVPLEGGGNGFSATIQFPSASELFWALTQLRHFDLENRLQLPNHPSARRNAAASLVAIDAMLGWLGRRHRLPESLKPGYMRGLAAEIDFLCNDLPSMEHIPPAIRSLISRPFRDLPPDGFGIVCARDEERERRSQKKVERRCANGKRDLTRLGEYLSMPGYVMPRPGDGENPYLYTAILFSTENGTDEVVVVLDSELVGCASYVLRGPESEVLGIVKHQRIKLRASPFFVGKVDHNHGGSWRGEVRELIARARAKRSSDVAASA